MKRKVVPRPKLILFILIAGLGLYKLFSKSDNITFGDFLACIIISLMVWGIFIWGYDNKEAK